MRKSIVVVVVVGLLLLVGWPAHFENRHSEADNGRHNHGQAGARRSVRRSAGIQEGLGGQCCRAGKVARRAASKSGG